LVSQLAQTVYNTCVLSYMLVIRMDIINRDGYGREAYFDREKLEKIKDVSMHSEAINQRCIKQYAELLERNICEYIKLVVQYHLEAGLKACVVMIDRMKQKKKDAVVTQLQHLSLRINTRVLISFEDGVLDLLYQVKTPEN
jgi:hypothetical protein